MVSLADLEIDQTLEARLIEIRRHLHQHPELSFREFNTSQLVADCLREWGIPFQPIGETGIIVDIVGGSGEGPHLGIRADMDALPIQEQTGLPFASTNPGVMHACGHDGHTAILLGTVYQLHQWREHFSGRVRCIFQPGEEAGGAAQQMVQAGVLDNPPIDGMLALHLWPHLPHGTVGVRYGTITASCDNFQIEIEGKAGHSARPHQAIDAIAISAQVLQALSYMVTKGNNPVDPVVIHIGKIQGGTASNIVADHVVMDGTMRSVSLESRTRVKDQLIQSVGSLVASLGGAAKIHFSEGDPAVMNDEDLTRTVEESAKELLGSQAVVLLKEPSMGADDFGAFAEKVPSTYFRLGVAQPEAPVYDLHHPKFQFQDNVIPIGVKLFTRTVLRNLQK